MPKALRPSMVINRVWHLLVLNVNGLLCQAMHVKYRKEWKPLVGVVRCGNKFVSPRASYCEFLEMCDSRFDNGIWFSTTQPNLTPMVQILLDEVLGVKPMFYGVQKMFCDRHYQDFANYK
jgi:hypothetical protein